jgi:hypothetical protein
VDKVANLVDVHKGTVVQLPPKKEQSGMCLMHELSSELYCEPCNLMGVGSDEIDFVYDTGTVSGVIGKREQEILKKLKMKMF